MIIWIASYPRSGNTYYRMLLYYLYGVKTYSAYSEYVFEEIGVSGVVGHEPLPAPIEELARDEEIYFVKTHELPPDASPAVYLVRDGRDALVSYARYINSFNQEPFPFQKVSKLTRLGEILSPKGFFHRTLRELISNDQFLGGWNNNVLEWTRCRQGGANTFVIRYEDLVADPTAWLEKSLKALQIQLEPVGGALPSFDELHEKWPQFFRKGKFGSWREEMPENLRDLFWKHHAEAMAAFGYQREPTSSESG